MERLLLVAWLLVGACRRPVHEFRFCFGFLADKVSIGIFVLIFGQREVCVGHRHGGFLVSVLLSLFLELLDDSDYNDRHD